MRMHANIVAQFSHHKRIKRQMLRQCLKLLTIQVATSQHPALDCVKTIRCYYAIMLFLLEIVNE